MNSRCKGLWAILLLLTGPAAAQAPGWQAGTAIGGGYSLVEATQADASGNVLLVGRFSGRVTFGGTTLTSNGGTDGFVAKWNAGNQSFVWALPLSSGDDDYALALAVSSSGIYVGGGYRGSTLSLGSHSLTNTTPGFEDGYVVKLTDAGNSASVTWSQPVRGRGDEAVTNLAVEGTTLYMAGGFASVNTQFGALAITSANGQDNTGHDDAFVARLTDTGARATWNWARQLGGAATYVNGLTCAGGNVYLVGRFTQGNAVFDATTLRAGAVFDIEGWVAKLRDQGTAATTAWAYQVGGPNYDFVNAVAVAGSALYIGGNFSPPTATFGGITITPATSYGAHAYVAKLVDAGSTAAFQWVAQAGGDTYANVRALAVRAGSVYLAGAFGALSSAGSQGPVAFGSTALTTAGLLDTYVARLVDTGSTATFIWVQQAGGSGHDSATGVSLTGNKVVVVGGFSSATIAFGAATLSGTNANERSFVAQLTDAVGLATAPSGSGTKFWTVYPSPAHSTATVQLPAHTVQGTPAILTLLDARGQTVRSETLQLAVAPAPHPLDLTGLAPGLYLLRLAAGGTTATQRLVVE
jgi:hypothetical protein